MTAAHERTDGLARWIVLVAFLCLLVVLICTWVLTRDYWIPAMLASSAVGLVAGIVCHELGHMLCAVLLSVPVKMVSIGIGPMLWRGRIGETRFELRAVPCGELMQCDPQPIVRRFSMLLVTLGGVLGNAALIGLVNAIDPAVGPTLGHDYLRPVVFAQYYLIVVNLAPFWTRTGDVRTGSDGLQLLLLLTGIVLGGPRWISRMLASAINGVLFGLLLYSVYSLFPSGWWPSMNVWGVVGSSAAGAMLVGCFELGARRKAKNSE